MVLMEMNIRSNFGMVVHNVAHLMRKRFEARAVGFGLSAAQWRLLFQLKKEPGISQARLADILEIEPISVSRLLDRMQQAGWIERREDAEDRRVRAIHPTKKAIDGFEAMRSIADRIFDEALAGLTREERAAIMRGLGKIADNLSDGDTGCRTEELQGTHAK